MSAVRYGFVELWDDLENSYNKFVSESTVCASSDEDEEAYQLAHRTLGEMIKVGREAQAMSLWYPVAKATLGMKAKNAFLENFGPDETPPVKGVKSVVFLKDVILPHIERCLKVEYDPMFTWLCSVIGVDLEAENQRARELSENYKRIIAESGFLVEAENEVHGASFRLFSSRSGEVVSMPAPETAAVTVVPRPGD